MFKHMNKQNVFNFILDDSYSNLVDYLSLF